MRLDKFLSECSLGTRSEVKTLIKKGLVSVNDNPVKDPGFAVDEASDKVVCKGSPVLYKKFTYYVLNKPQGYVCSKDESEGKTVYELLPKEYAKLNPVGRLDKDTEGILLFTDDGDLNHRLLSPKNHVWKTYDVLCEKDVTEEDLNKLREGVLLDDEMTLPAKAEYLDSTNHIALTICEGKFHQVKRMLAATCNKVTALKRVSFGNLSLNDLDLPVGEGKEIERKGIE
jgi:16S rRNA pseudouridine516 synthase